MTFYQSTTQLAAGKLQTPSLGTSLPSSSTHNKKIQLHIWQPECNPKPALEPKWAQKGMRMTSSLCVIFFHQPIIQSVEGAEQCPPRKLHRRPISWSHNKNICLLWTQKTWIKWTKALILHQKHHISSTGIRKKKTLELVLTTLRQQIYIQSMSADIQHL